MTSETSIQMKATATSIEYRELADQFTSTIGQILAAVAAINYDRDAAIYAHDQGLLVISTTDGDNFTLEPSDRKSLKRF